MFYRSVSLAPFRSPASPSQTIRWRSSPKSGPMPRSAEAPEARPPNMVSEQYFQNKKDEMVGRAGGRAKSCPDKRNRAIVVAKVLRLLPHGLHVSSTLCTLVRPAESTHPKVAGARIL